MNAKQIRMHGFLVCILTVFALAFTALSLTGCSLLEDKKEDLYFELYNNDTEYKVIRGGDNGGSIVIPATHNEKPVTRITDYTFLDSSITSVTIPASVESIGRLAFSNCSSLKTVTFKENSQLSRIEGEAFKNCIIITSFTIPENIETMDSRVFQGWTASQTIYVPFKSEMEASVTWKESRRWRDDCNAKIVYKE